MSGWLLVLVGLAMLMTPPLWLIVRLNRDHAGMRWWIAVAVGGVLGLCAGLWAGFFSEYDPGDGSRLQGFPLPYAVDRPTSAAEPPARWRAEGSAGPLLIGGIDTLLVAGLMQLPTALLYLMLQAWRRATRPRPAPRRG